MGNRRVSFGSIESSTFSKGSTIGTSSSKSIVRIDDDDFPIQESISFQSPHHQFMAQNGDTTSEKTDSLISHSQLSDSFSSSSLQTQSDDETSPLPPTTNQRTNSSNLDTSAWMSKIKANPILWEDEGFFLKKNYLFRF